MDCEALITEVLNRTPLWDTSHHHHHNRSILTKLWAEVSKKLGISVRNARQKWKYLRDQYRKEIKRISECQTDDHASKYEPSWPYFHMLHFLKDQIATSGNLDSTIHISTEETQSRTESQTLCSDEENPLPNNISDETDIDASQKSQDTSRRSSKRYLSQSKAFSAKLLKLEEKKLELLANHQNDIKGEKSDDYYFFMSLIPMVQKLNLLHKMKVRSGIQQLILDELSHLQEFRQSPSFTGLACSTPMPTTSSSACRSCSCYKNQHH